MAPGSEATQAEARAEAARRGSTVGGGRAHHRASHADGRETPQSNKVWSLVGRLSVQAAERGLRVYLQDEHGTSIDALDYMISSAFSNSEELKGIWANLVWDALEHEEKNENAEFHVK